MITSQIEDWLAALEKGELQLSLGELAVLGPGEWRSDGWGLLSWSLDDGVHIHAETTAPEPLTSLPVPGTFKPGEVIAEAYYRSLEGRTFDGWSVGCGRFYENPSTTLGGTDERWSISCHEAMLSRDTDMEDDPCLMAILHPINLTRFPRPSVLTDSNPHFGWQTRTEWDWLEFEAPFGHVAARKLGTDKATVFIKGDLDQAGYEQALDAVRQAFSFVEGRSVRILGYEARMHGKHLRKLWPPTSTTKNRFAPVLGLSLATPDLFEPLLRSATQFIHTDRGRMAFDHLRMCWDSSDNYGTLRARSTCNAIEALAKLLIENGDASLTEKQGKELEGIIGSLEDKRADLGDRFVDRIKGCLEKLRHESSLDTLWKWVKEGKLGLSEEDTKAWSKLRNPASHGGLLFMESEPDKRARAHRMHDRLKGVVNKLLLHGMGYDGRYFDYGSYRLLKFPAIDEGT